jgi:curved DNA-binding protein CbpA
MNTLYDLLGALPQDDAEGLRSAFRRAVKGAHPDLRPDDPDAALKFREIVRVYEILGDAEQRAAYDHLLALARLEQDQVSKQAVFVRVHRFASGVMAFAGVSIATIGGYLLFMHMSAASVAPPDDIDAATRASAAIAAASPAVPADTTDNGAPSAKPESPGIPGETTAPSVALPQSNAESAPPANAGPAPDLAATETRSLRARGMSAYRHGDLNGAIADLDQALQRDPRFLPAYIDRGIILYRMRKFGRAFADIAPAKRIAEATRSKFAPTTAGQRHLDQAANAPLVMLLSQRQKAARKSSTAEPLRER